MAFNEDAELNEPAQRFEVVFSTGRPLDKNDLSMPPSAYIAMGRYTQPRRADWSRRRNPHLGDS